MNQPDPIAPTSSDNEADDLFDVYFEYNKILRTWFVAFGVGGPAMFLVNDDIARALNDSGNLKCVAGLFLGGAAAQVAGSFINKVGSWYEYYATVDKTAGRTLHCRLAVWLMHQFWIDVLIDAATIAMFGTAIWKMMVVFGSVG